MSANLDRFSCGVTPTVPDEVGNCEACGGVIYDYELARCRVCDAVIHEGCEKRCDVCGAAGCKCCLWENEEDSFLYCTSCQEKYQATEQVTLVDVVRAVKEKLS